MAEISNPTTQTPRESGVDRIWLDWNQPLLRQAAAWLLDRAEREDGLLRLDRTVCVTPGRRAGRVLLEEALRQSDAGGERILPFRTLTPGVMVDALAERDPELDAAGATGLESELAWITALQQQDERTLAALMAEIPQRGDRAGWQALARMVHRLHVELTGHRRTFAEVAEAVGRLGREGEQQRWEALDAIAKDYRAVLAKLGGGGLVDAELDRQRAAAEGALLDDVEIVLIGVTELNQVQRTVLARMAGRVTALIHAPADHAEGFDALGCVQPAYWSQRVIDLAAEQIIIADRPPDQAQQVMRELAHLSAAVDEVTIGVEDAALADQLELAARWADVQIHRADGVPLNRTGPFRLLSALADWIEQPQFAAFAALLRHRDLEQALHEQLRHQPHDQIARNIGDWLALLDDYYAEHLHEQLTGTWLGDDEKRERLKMLHRMVGTLVQPLMDRRARPLGTWAEAIMAVLAEVYAPSTQPDDRGIDDRVLDACRAIRQALVEFTQVHPELQPSVRAHEAIRMALDRIRDEALPAPVRDDQIESLGWLELHMDLAPMLILMGVNDGTIPASVTSDPFLPDSLRAQLGLLDNAHRYARDAYRLEAINRSRDRLIVITGRSSSDGEPLPPSRLLLACDRDALPRRVRMLSDADRAVRYPLPAGMALESEASRFTVPEPPSEPPEVESMSVTSFALYLKCPYRFWLERIERLKAVDDSAMELDPMHFGTLAHDVLQQFGEDAAVCHSDDADAIRAFLRDALDQQMKRLFGTSPMPAIRIQQQRLARRLDAFADRQAALRREGWRIMDCELVLPEDVSLDVPGQNPMRITGKIDRIDQHEKTGAYRIIDYKTGDKPTTPYEAHHGRKTKSDEWVNLQLPLYRHLAQQVDIAGTIEVGFFVLPRDPAACGWLAAAWEDADYESAIDEAQRIVREVRRGAFWPPRDVNDRYDVFAGICQTNVFGRDDFGSDEGGSNGEGGGA